MHKKRLVWLALFLALALGLAACGGGDDDGSAGEKLFKQTVIGSASSPGCVTCHSLDVDVALVGPSQAGVASRAGSSVSGQSAEQYLRNSIINPNDHIVEGFAEGVMYPNYGAELSDQEVDDLVAFMLTLK